jgi:uncharacterized protein (DUF1501 family)
VARHLTSIGADNGIMPAVSTGGSPDTLLGLSNVASLQTIDNFGYSGDYQQIDFQRVALRQLYTGDNWFQQAGSEALDVVDRIALANPSNYVPENGATYPDEDFGRSLKVIAQLIKTDLGMQTASIDLGGWDTHENEGGDGQGYFANQVGILSQGLQAFYTDMLRNVGRITIVVMSEFGRRVAENSSGGTDHGHGNFIFVLGGNVNGGVFGNWPTLKTAALDEGADLAITTDYRTILSEILLKRLNNGNLDQVFPGFNSYQALGVVKGIEASLTYHNYLPASLVTR